MMKNLKKLLLDLNDLSSVEMIINDYNDFNCISRCI